MNTLLVCAAVALMTVAQLLQKRAADAAARDPGGGALLLRMARQKQTWWAVLCLALGSGVWLAVLYRMDVSTAFPFLSLGFVAVVLLARLTLNERVTRVRWLGVGAIVAGVALIAGT